jgi:putative GTP pyrophosphokinase
MTASPEADLSPEADAGAAFDFPAHGQRALSDYLRVREFYVHLSQVVQQILRECLKGRGVQVHSVEARAKDPVSFEKKASQRLEADPNEPKYPEPLKQITDLAGARVITFFPGSLDEIDRIIQDEFEILERSDKGAALVEEERFGYQSIHYLVRMHTKRSALSEYRDFAGTTVEIQVRTILQHAWAEIEHDIQYKSAALIPREIRRRFMSLAGLLELADREFQSIQVSYALITETARENVAKGELSDVEITPDALKVYLDKRIGPDGRMADWSYSWTARLLRRLGFTTLQQVEKCIRDYDDDKLSRLAEYYRVGQLSRFEHMLLAGMGSKFIERHPFASEGAFAVRRRGFLERFQGSGVVIGSYDPITPASDANESSPSL